MNTAIARLVSHLEHRPAAPAFSLGGRTISFGALAERSARYARWLHERGFRPGDRVAAWLDTSLEMIIALLGHYRAGLIHVPINTRYGALEIEHVLADSGARLLLVDDDTSARFGHVARNRHQNALECIVTMERSEHVDHAHFQAVSTSPEPVDVSTWPQDDEQIALLIYTSGTTGPSKGVQLSFRAIAHGIGALTDLWQWTSADRLILALPLFHVHGLGIGVHGTLIQGNHTEVQAGFDPLRIHEAIAHRQGTIFMGVPTMYTRLVRALDEHPEWGPQWKNVRLFTSGSAALNANIFSRFEEHTTHRILERYGMSETLLTVSNPYPAELRKPGAIGHPIDGVDVQVLDDDLLPVEQGAVGQLAVRGPTLFSGYWKLQEKTREVFCEGWFLTGDAVYIDDEGYLVHVGRQSVDIIKSGGYKISAREIEDALLTHPNVEEVAVVGLPDEEWGERIAAAIVATPDAPPDAPWLAWCQTHLDGRLARFKHPRQVMLLDAIPRNALGKVQKHRIRDFQQ
jgi:acyl-CoA synthetase (AMP-forming)/AMP-acid ligase II